MLESREVTWFPSYGAEVRGGTANCMVIVSDELIGSPVVTAPDFLIIMSEASLHKFLPKLKPKGLFMYDSSLLHEVPDRGDVTMQGVPATQMASHLGNTKSANMVLLGAFVAKTGILNETSLYEALEGSMPGRKKKIVETNKKALREGMRYIENKKSKNS
jgi:2-oxoglutarate ferredoxin oxidoreductase subunit gamma